MPSSNPDDSITGNSGRVCVCDGRPQSDNIFYHTATADQTTFYGQNKLAEAGML